MIAALLAQQLNFTSVGSEYQPLTQITPQTVVSAVIQDGLVVICVVCFFFLLLGGLKWILSQGEKDKIASATKTITNALIGLIIALSILLILGLLSSFTRTNLFEFCIPGITSQCNIPAYVPPSSASPPTGNTGPGVGPTNGNCVCGGPAAGLCAPDNIVAQGTTACYQCQGANGWVPRTDLTYPTGCSQVITCGTCP